MKSQNQNTKTTTTTTTKNNPVETPKTPIIISITECHKGDIIRYLSSKKLYMVAFETPEDSPKPYKLLVSSTQTYKSYKTNFKVERVLTQSQTLESDYQKILTTFNSEKNTNFTNFLSIINKEVQNLKNQILLDQAKQSNSNPSTNPEEEQPQSVEQPTK